ncbi:MarR family transcriptional regulator [Tsukamurella sp. 8F]|uniref:MarR family winged helix-turn-helix transcriptional regulator n=1 Tax=unclassified Tsukamurella TaxID=2633480 RepID=UPI0023B8E73F|nr:MULTISPECIES: MarR family transcriptional regulator [unclassified Tsukamurella]MDF0529554.1 MarR family transcriptional regulator [Tsukamurella sp. 8J]MDF0585758.1 MarR family transcriptional regulator [Tsukamurella sp. 8F]
MSRSHAGDAVTDLVLPAFELNGEFLAAAEAIARPAGLSPAQWQVLGATLDEPLPVAEIARRVGLGLARQSVQRVADDLVARGWAEYLPNPMHKRAKLVSPTLLGRGTLGRLREAQHAWANAVGAAVTERELTEARELITRISAASRAARGAAATPGSQPS